MLRSKDELKLEKSVVENESKLFLLNVVGSVQGNLPVERTIKTNYQGDGKENKTQTTSAREADRFLQMN